MEKDGTEIVASGELHGGVAAADTSLSAWHTLELAFEREAGLCHWRAGVSCSRAWTSARASFSLPKKLPSLISLSLKSHFD